MTTTRKVRRRAATGQLARYLNAPYVRMIIPNTEEGGYLAEVLELPGCITDGDTLEEAYHNLEDAMAGWIGASLANGRPIPEAVGDKEYSGHFPLRMSTELHRASALRAIQEGVSLNQWITGAIAEKVAKADLAEELTVKIASKVAERISLDELADKITPKVVQRISVRAVQAFEIQADIPASTAATTAATTPSKMTKASRTTEGIVLAPEPVALTTERTPWRAVKAGVEVNQDA